MRHKGYAFVCAYRNGGEFQRDTGICQTTLWTDRGRRGRRSRGVCLRPGGGQAGRLLYGRPQWVDVHHYRSFQHDFGRSPDLYALVFDAADWIAGHCGGNERAGACAQPPDRTDQRDGSGAGKLLLRHLPGQCRAGDLRYRTISGGICRNRGPMPTCSIISAR